MIDHATRMNAGPRAERFREMAHVVGAKDESPEGFLRWLAELKTQIGIPAKLSQVGVTPEHHKRLPDLALADSCHLNNPVPVTRADFVRIFQEAA